MKLREGKSKVPVAPKALQVVFASATGVAFVALLVFVMVRPTTAEQTIAQSNAVAESSEIQLSEEAQKKASIDGTSEGISTVEVKKPVVIAPEVQSEVSVDGGEAEAPAAEAPAVIVKPAEEPKQEVAVETPKVEEKKSPTSAKTLTYIARAGDSYTGIARAAVARVAATEKLTLSPAQKVAAETFLTQAAGAGELAVDQTVALSADEVKKAIAQAQDLSDEELAAWDVFANQVDFDADDTPEPVADDGAAGDAIDGGATNGGSADAGATGGDSGGGSGN